MAPVNPLQSRFGLFCFDPGPEDSERVFIHMRSVVQRTWDVLDVIIVNLAPDAWGLLFMTQTRFLIFLSGYGWTVSPSRGAR